MRRIKKCMRLGGGGGGRQDDLDAPQACSGSEPLQSNQQLCRMENKKAEREEEEKRQMPLKNCVGCGGWGGGGQKKTISFLHNWCQSNTESLAAVLGGICGEITLRSADCSLFWIWTWKFFREFLFLVLFFLLLLWTKVWPPTLKASTGDRKIELISYLPFYSYFSPSITLKMSLLRYYFPFCFPSFEFTATTSLSDAVRKAAKSCTASKCNRRQRLLTVHLEHWRWAGSNRTFLSQMFENTLSALSSHRVSVFIFSRFLHQVLRIALISVCVRVPNSLLWPTFVIFICWLESHL